MALRSLVLSIDPVATGALLAACDTADAVLLEVAVAGGSAHRLVFRVRASGRAERPGELRVEADDAAQLVRGDGTTELVTAAPSETAELFAERRGELCAVVHGRMRLVAWVHLEDDDLAFRVVAGGDPATRPTVPSTRAAA